MFNRARLKLTGYYLLIIMSISILFSVAVYKALTREYNYLSQREVMREGSMRFFPPLAITPLPRRFQLDPEVLEESRQRVEIVLIIINLIILGLSGVLGYFLAGRTLEPIEEMLSEQNRFITDSSHELRTPLTALRSEIEVALRDKGLSLSEAKKLLQSNLEEVNNLQSLSDNLIKLTQYQKGANHFTLKEVSLSEVVQEAVKKASPLAKNKKIKISTEVKNVQIEGNKQTLIDLLVIFLDNAVKYSYQGKDVTITSERPDHSVVISINDQGIGISKEDLPHIFDRFYRVDKSRTKVEASGYGLGLSIAKEIAEKHNGKIWVESQLEKGTTFNIQLPLKH